MKKYVCDVCGYVYDPAVGDPDNGIAPGTAFEDFRMVVFLSYFQTDNNCRLAFFII